MEANPRSQLDPDPWDGSSSKSIVLGDAWELLSAVLRSDMLGLLALVSMTGRASEARSVEVIGEGEEVWRLGNSLSSSRGICLLSPAVEKTPVAAAGSPQLVVTGAAVALLLPELAVVDAL